MEIPFKFKTLEETKLSHQQQNTVFNSSPLRTPEKTVFAPNLITFKNPTTKMNQTPASIAQMKQSISMLLSSKNKDSLAQLKMRHQTS